MRLWSLHPSYLDPQGLVALWREALLARAVLRGETRGYRHHPQLHRFHEHAQPRSAINAYLADVHAEACTREYTFDRSKLGPKRPVSPIPVTRGQIACELEHLRKKLEQRNPAYLCRLPKEARAARVHPLFQVIAGPVADWERAV